MVLLLSADDFYQYSAVFASSALEFVVNHNKVEMTPFLSQRFLHDCEHELHMNRCL